MIPKRLFFYWHDEHLPECLNRFVMSWKKQNPTFEVVILNQKNVDQFVSVYPKNFENLKIQHQCDYIRLKVLHDYGGVYADISTICLKPLESFIDFEKDGLVGKRYFFSPGIIENFFLASNEQNEELKAWLDELNFAIELGFENYKKVFLARHRFTFFNLPYMTPYACFYDVLRHNQNVTYLFHEHNFQFLLNRNVKKLFQNKVDLSKYSFIKLFGSARSYFLETLPEYADQDLEIFKYYDPANFKNDLRHHVNYKNETSEFFGRILKRHKVVRRARSAEAIGKMSARA